MSGTIGVRGFLGSSEEELEGGLLFVAMTAAKVYEACAVCFEIFCDIGPVIPLSQG